MAANPKEDKLKRLNAYVNKIKSLMESPLPHKHQSRKDTYLFFLKKELEQTQRQIDALKVG